MTEPDAVPANRGLGSIDYSRDPKAVYCVDAAGDRWRVHACVYAQGKYLHIGLPGAAGATCRVFVSAADRRRSHTRLKGEICEATEAHLHRQHRNAGNLPTESFISHTSAR